MLWRQLCWPGKDELSQRAGDPLPRSFGVESKPATKVLLQRNQLGCGAYYLGEAEIAAQRIRPDLGFRGKWLQFS